MNSLKTLGMLHEGVTTNSYITSTTQYHIITTANNGLKCFTRRAPTIKQGAAFGAEVVKYKISGRYSTGYSDWRADAGSGNL